MSTTSTLFEAFLTSWPAETGLAVSLVITSIIYLRGWRILSRRDPQRWQPRQPIAFAAGLASIFFALASPIEPFSFLFLQVHMVQHLLLMMVAPPLLWLGDPLFPLLRGVPVPVRRYWIAPLPQAPVLRRFFAALTNPICALPIFVAATWLWHAPRLYELAIRSDAWHYAQHLTFLLASLIFWYPVVRPYPSRPKWPRWLLFPYLILTDVQNTVLSALFTFSDRVIYKHYEQMPRIDGVSALDDQSTAGVLMWVPGSIAFLVPLLWIGTRSLFATEPPPKRIALTMAGDDRFDVLRVPVLGPFLQWRHARLAMQIPLLVSAGLLIYDGLTGPQVAPLNLAGVLPWIHWRGFLILGLLVAGNTFCMACPFMLPRALARRLLPQPFAWPRRLRNKWLAIGLLVAFLWSYEAFSLWDSPWLTAWIAIGYFGGALAVDGLFRGAAFCKYVCPIGQFNFVQSLVSPLEFKVREPAVCSECTTKDCIRGRPAENLRGCELSLFLPRKASNMDCTMCLDCIHACPHDNIGIIAAPPAAELWRDPSRSGIGRFSRRPDLAALVLVLVFGAFANAAGMVGPVVELQDRLQQHWGLTSSLPVVSTYYLLAIVLLPAALLIAARASIRFAFALVPLGFAMWLSHYSFHLFTSYDSAIPPIHRIAAEQGWDIFGSTVAACNCCRPVAGWLLHFEILALDLGLLLSLYTAYRMAPNHKLAIVAPWIVLIVALFALGIWIVMQPMQMRGTMMMAG